MSSMIAPKEDTEQEGTKRHEFVKEAMEYQQELFAKALTYLKNEQEAQDLLQITYKKAFENWEKYEIGTNCRAWLFTILRNTFINKYRSKKREREILNDDTQDVKKKFHNRRGTDYYHSPEEDATKREFSPEVKDALKELSEKFRRVVILCDLHDYTYKEIAHTLDCPVGTVMSRLFRGRKKLRKELADKAYERGIIDDTEPFQHEETNKTRKRLREEAD